MFPIKRTVFFIPYRNPVWYEKYGTFNRNTRVRVLITKLPTLVEKKSKYVASTFDSFLAGGDRNQVYAAYSSVPIKRTVFFIPYTVSKNTVRLIGTIEYTYSVSGQICLCISILLL